MKKNPLVGSFKSRKFRKFIKRVINRWKFIQKVRKGSVNVSILKEYTEAYAINTPDINDNFLFVVNSFNNMLSGFTIGSIDKSEGNSMMRILFAVCRCFRGIFRSASIHASILGIYASSTG